MESGTGVWDGDPLPYYWTCLCQKLEGWTFSWSTVLVIDLNMEPSEIEGWKKKGKYLPFTTWEGYAKKNRQQESD